jgi:hypothetical protein
MPLSLSESKTINEMSKSLYNFLPGKAHPFGIQDLSFKGVVDRLGLSQFWLIGSKLPAITILLQKTFESRRNQFCALILEIVHSGMTYRNNKAEPITREEICRLNELIGKLQFKIPELWDRKFLDSLPSEGVEKRRKEKPVVNPKDLDDLKTRLLKLDKLDPQPRGLAFETFLRDLFALFGLSPRGAFRLTGEQIDGSLQIGSDTYLIEAKWHSKKTTLGELRDLIGSVESKATWSRGLFISYSGFTDECLEAFPKEHSKNIIGMTAQDIFHILDGEITLTDAINRKARRAAETGAFYTSVFELTRCL